MNEHYEKAQQLHNAGGERNRITDYLYSEGLTVQEVRLIMSRIDEEEIHNAYQQEKLKMERNKFIGALIISICGGYYNYLEHQAEKDITFLISLIPFGLFVYFYRQYWFIKNKRFNSQRIIQENKRSTKTKYF